MLDNIFHLDGDIIEAMKEPKFPWESMHHHYFFLPKNMFMPTSAPTHDICALDSKDFLPLGNVDLFKNLIPSLDAFKEGNMSNISPTTKVNILNKPGKIEEIFVGETFSPKEVTAYTSLFQEQRDIFAWDYFEMLGINTTIVEHHIDMCPDTHPIRQKQSHLHPSKAEAIKQEIDKLHKVGFIYPITYMS